MLRSQLEEFLAAWGTWSRQVRSGPDSRLRCGSAEGLHRAELGNVFVDDVEPLEPDIADDLGLSSPR
jgi:hypothetical protein